MTHIVGRCLRMRKITLWGGFGNREDPQGRPSASAGHKRGAHPFARPGGALNEENHTMQQPTQRQIREWMEEGARRERRRQHLKAKAAQQPTTPPADCQKDLKHEMRRRMFEVLGHGTDRLQDW
jgi:hypothetical protein